MGGGGGLRETVFVLLENSLKLFDGIFSSVFFVMTSSSGGKLRFEKKSIKVFSRIAAKAKIVLCS